MTLASPLVMVIFGATGDLMHRKLMPALYHLVRDGEMSRDIYIVGVGRREITTDQFRELMARSVCDRYGDTLDLSLWGRLTARMYYQKGHFEEKVLYDELTTLLTQFDDELAACVPRFFYLATPPEHYETILKHLHKSKLSEGCLPASAYAAAKRAGGQGFAAYTRVLIEKPFGKDLQTARHLDQLLGRIFEERQIYRIDHYLGKETIQNILSFRFANGIFEPTWNDKFIDHVQVALLEDTGIDSRGQFYDGVGAIRDVVQNHMLQMLALTAMEQPFAFDAASIRKERARVLRSIELSGDVVRGQYEEYRTEKNVDPKSQTETFAAVKLMVNLPRWKNVPFYLRTGKKLKKKMTEISLHYKKPEVCTGPVCLFPEPDVMRNVLSLRIHPDDGIHLRLMVKKPGFGMKLTDTPMAFHYKDAFPDFAQPEAYEKLLLDAIRGDQTLFAHSDEIEASWKVITKILESLLPAHAYASGRWGPKRGEELIKKDS